jgi:4-amino-4-deoxy-L-arabinose transferase-like glycosyltransferase
MALAVGVAIVVRSALAISDEVVFNDGPGFIRIAEALGRGDFRDALSHPFHPLTSWAMLALHAALGVGLEAAGKVLSVVSGGVATAALYGLARAGLGPRIAWISALLFAVHPRMAVVGSGVQSDGLHLALVLLALALGWWGLRERRPSLALGAGVGCGLAYLTRPEGLAVAVVFCAALGATILWRRIRPGPGLLLAGAFSVGLLGVSGPYLVTLHQVSGEWTLTHKKSLARALSFDALGAGAGAAREETLQQPTGALGATVSPRAPDTALGELVWDGLRAIHPAFGVLVLLGFRLRRPSAHTLYLLGFVGVIAVTLLLLRLDAGYVSRRHWLASAALLLPFAARGLVDGVQVLARDWLGEGAVPRLASAAVGVVVAGFALHAFLDREEPVKLARKEAAVWLREVQAPQSIAAPRSRIAYYAGAARHLEVPKTNDPAEFVREVRSSGAEFLLAEEEWIPPALRAGGRGLLPLHRVSYDQGVVLVFRVEEALVSDVGAGGQD